MFTVGSYRAILLWSVAMLQTRRLAMGLGVYGLMLGSVTNAAQFFGVLSLAVHGFGLVVLARSIWFIVAGSLLMRDADMKNPFAEPATD